MVTLALIQGVVNTFVIFLARVIGHTVDRVVFRNEQGHGPAFWITTIVAELVLGLLATMIVMWFSRQREFRADAGGARLAGRQHMIGALERLMQRHAGAAARQDGGLRHRGRRRRRSQASLHVAPAARGADRGTLRPGRLKPWPLPRAGRAPSGARPFSDGGPVQRGLTPARADRSLFSLVLAILRSYA